MKVLIACEESQAVCIEFRKLGHEAFSCDLQPCSGGHPEWHIQDNVMNVLRHDIISPFTTEWDMVIAHPPCDFLTVSNTYINRGCSKYTADEAQELRKKAIMFFEFFTHLKNRFVAIENPIGIMSSIYRKPDQIIQPYQFGHPESKSTCLWLKGLPLLKHTNILNKPACGHWNNQTKSGQNNIPPSKDRAKIRSKTYPGIAKAMAEQWGKPESFFKETLF